MNERLKYQGRLRVKQLEARKLEQQLGGLLRSLRDLLDPTEKLTELEGELIATQGLEFGARMGEYKALLEEIAKIEKLLGV